jgi:hypothetical protein
VNVLPQPRTGQTNVTSCPRRTMNFEFTAAPMGVALCIGGAETGNPLKIAYKVSDVAAMSVSSPSATSLKNTGSSCPTFATWYSAPPSEGSGKEAKPASATSACSADVCIPLRKHNQQVNPFLEYPTQSLWLQSLHVWHLIVRCNPGATGRHWLGVEQPNSRTDRDRHKRTGISRGDRQLRGKRNRVPTGWVHRGPQQRYRVP